MARDNAGRARQDGVSRESGARASNAGLACTAAASPGTLRQCRRLAAAVLGLVTVAPAFALAQSDTGRADGIGAPRGVLLAPSGGRDKAAGALERLIDHGRLDEARAMLRQQLAEHGERPRLLFLDAMLLYKEKQYLESLRMLERGLALSDPGADVYKLAGLNLVSLGRRDLAGACFEAAIALAPHDFMAYYYLGLNELTDRRYDRAGDLLRRVITLRPEYLDAHILLGVAEEGGGKENEAIATYRRAIDRAEQQGLKTDAPFLYLARLLISLQRYEESVAPLKRAMELDAASSEARTLLGQALAQLGRYEEALRALTAAVALAPDNKTAHFVLMTVYNRLGRRDEAARAMQLFRAIEASDEIARARQVSDRTNRRSNDGR